MDVDSPTLEACLFCLAKRTRPLCRSSQRPQPRKQRIRERQLMGVCCGGLMNAYFPDVRQIECHGILLYFVYMHALWKAFTHIYIYTYIYINTCIYIIYLYIYIYISAFGGGGSPPLGQLCSKPSFLRNMLKQNPHHQHVIFWGTTHNWSKK